jgi:hypothetical protein
MCHAHVDPKYLMQDTEATFRAAQAASQAEGAALETDVTIPPHLIPGWRGVWARLRAFVPRRAKPAAFPAE